MQWITKQVRYPIDAVKKGIQGRVYVSFIIETDGSISNPKIIKGSDPRLDPEAIRIIEKMPKWEPGKLKGKPVRTSYVLPIAFQS